MDGPCHLTAGPDSLDQGTRVKQCQGAKEVKQSLHKATPESQTPRRCCLANPFADHNVLSVLSARNSENHNTARGKGWRLALTHQWPCLSEPLNWSSWVKAVTDDTVLKDWKMTSCTRPCSSAGAGFRAPIWQLQPTEPVAATWAVC